MNTRSFQIPGILKTLMLLAAGVLIGRLIKPASTASDAHDHGAATAAGTIWTCSMDPQVRQSEPGKCPLCGMDLIPLTDDAGSDDPYEIRMSATAMQLANIRTAVIGTGAATREIRLNGKVQADERLVFTQVSHLDGRVEQLNVNFTGEPVQKGQTIAGIYSPPLVTAQEELFAALKIKDLQPGLAIAAREKLKNWKLSDAQIDDIIAGGKPRERFPILADVSGVVLEKKVNLGDYLMRGMPLYQVVDLSRVWVLFDVYESDLTWVKNGSLITFEVPSLPGASFSGKVTFMDPVIDPATRVARARIEVANPGRQLKPEMFADGLVKTQLSRAGATLLVPKSAVLWTGERSVVYIKQQNDQNISFRMQEITLGPLAGDRYVVQSGLEPGTEIAVNGAFSIDAAAQLAGKYSMMSPPGTSGMKLSSEAQAMLAPVFEQYFSLKDALVAGDMGKAKPSVQTLRQAVQKVASSGLGEEVAPVWREHESLLKVLLEQMNKAGDLETVRKHFKPLSEHFVVLAKALGSLDGQPVYVQHCPMADQNEGADWLSRDKNILNPYFGNQMLTCGSTKATIAASPASNKNSIHHH